MSAKGQKADMCHSLNLGPAAYFEATIRTPPILRCWISSTKRM